MFQRVLVIECSFSTVFAYIRVEANVSGVPGTIFGVVSSSVNLKATVEHIATATPTRHTHTTHDTRPGTRHSRRQHRAPDTDDIRRLDRPRHVDRTVRRALRRPSSVPLRALVTLSQRKRKYGPASRVCDTMMATRHTCNAVVDASSTAERKGRYFSSGAAHHAVRVLLDHC